MNREQMIAWLILEEVTLAVAPIQGDKHGRTVWSVRDGKDELQRYNDRPSDNWARYVNMEPRSGRTFVSMDTLPDDVLRQLYEDVKRNREEPRTDDRLADAGGMGAAAPGAQIGWMARLAPWG